MFVGWAALMAGSLKQNAVTSVSRWNWCPNQLISSLLGTSEVSQCSSNPCVTRVPSVSNTLPPPVMRAPTPQDNVAALEPLTMMGTVEPEASGAPGQVPDFVRVWVTALAVKLMVPGTVIGGPEMGVSVKVKLMVY